MMSDHSAIDASTPDAGPLYFDVDNGVARVMLDCPKSINALSEEMLSAVQSCLDDIAAPHFSPFGVPGAGATKNELLAHCRERLAAFKRPRRLIIGEPAKTSTGKIRKNELRDLACPTT